MFLKIVSKSLKNFWNPEIDKLKNISIDLHQLWRLIGSPRHNSIINSERIKAKLAYKLAIKNSKENSLRANSDIINANLADKSGSSFWKCWNSTYKNDKRNHYSSIIDNLSNHTEIANSFKNYFDSTFINSSDDINAASEFQNLYTKLLNSPADTLPIDILDIEKAVSQLRLNKSADPDNLFSEHFIHCHPCIFTHLKLLFNP